MSLKDENACINHVQKTEIVTLSQMFAWRMAGIAGIRVILKESKTVKTVKAVKTVKKLHKVLLDTKLFIGKLRKALG